jgi:hypothetical protein
VAARYSGDVETQSSRRGSSWIVVVRWADRGGVRSFRVEVRGAPRTMSSADHDRMARQAINTVLVKKRKLPLERGTFGRIVLRRIFQAPCPR